MMNCARMGAAVHSRGFGGGICRPVRQDRAGRSLGAAEARNSRLLVPPFAGHGPTIIFEFFICGFEWNRSSPQPPIVTEELAGKIGRAATGSPQPPPGGGLQLASRRSARASPPLGCGTASGRNRSA